VRNNATVDIEEEIRRLDRAVLVITKVIVVREVADGRSRVHPRSDSSLQTLTSTTRHFQGLIGIKIKNVGSDDRD
jgi:hypothetical protein